MKYVHQPGSSLRKDPSCIKEGMAVSTWRTSSSVVAFLLLSIYSTQLVGLHINHDCGMKGEAKAQSAKGMDREYRGDCVRMDERPPLDLFYRDGSDSLVLIPTSYNIPVKDLSRISLGRVVVKNISYSTAKDIRVFVLISRETKSDLTGWRRLDHLLSEGFVAGFSMRLPNDFIVNPTEKFELTGFDPEIIGSRRGTLRCKIVLYANSLFVEKTLTFSTIR
jgi:hypothetical protein